MSGLLAISMTSGMLNVVAEWWGNLQWSVCSMAWTVLNQIEKIFRVLAGLGTTMKLDESTGQYVQSETNDIIVDALQNNVVRNLMMTIMLFGICVLVLCVILSIIRNVYKDDSKVTISSIFGQAIKAVIGFILIPSLCLVGVMFSNVILQAVDGATGASGDTKSFSHTIYQTCKKESAINLMEEYAKPEWAGTTEQEVLIAYCNYVYWKIKDPFQITGVELTTLDGKTGIYTASNMLSFYDALMDRYEDNFDGVEIGTSVDLYLRQTIMGVDRIFEGYETPRLDGEGLFEEGSWWDGLWGSDYKWSSVSTNDYKKVFEEGFWTTFWRHSGIGGLYSSNKISLTKTESTWDNDSFNTAFFISTDMNFLQAIVATVIILTALFNICFGLAKRILMLIMYYILSPIALALYPWDNGSAFGKWKGEFVGYTIGAYSAVAGINITLQIMPIIRTIKPFGSWGLDNFLQLVLFIALSLAMKDLIGTFSSWIGGKNLLSEGESTKKAVTAPVAAVAGAAIGAVAGGAAIVGSGIKHAKSVHSAGKSAFNDEKESFLLGKKSEAEDTMRNKLTFKADGSKRSTGELAKAFHMTKGKGESDEHFEARVNERMEDKIKYAGESALLDVNNEDAAIEAAFKAQKTAKQQARKDLKGTGGWATAGRAAGKLGTSALGLLGSSAGIDVQKAWKDGQTGVATDWKKTAEGTGIKFTGKTAENATAISNATHAGRIGAGLIGNTAIAASLGKDAQAAMDQLQNALTASMEQLRQEISENRTTPITMAELTTLLANPTLAKSAAESKAVNTYIRETRGADREMAILQNTIDATIAINSGFAGADEGKLRDLSRKGAADGFKDAKAYLLGEVQKSVEKSGKKWTGDMASEIEKQLDKYFKQNFKPNKD